MYSNNVVALPIKETVNLKMENGTELKIQSKVIGAVERRNIALSDAYRKLVEEQAKTEAEKNAMLFELQKKEEIIASLEAEKKSLTDQLNSLKAENIALMEENQQAKSEIMVVKSENNQLIGVISQLREGADGNNVQQLSNDNNNQVSDKASDHANGDQFEVERLLKHRKRYGKTQYFLRWANFDCSHDSWVDENDLSCTKLLEEYHANRNTK